MVGVRCFRTYTNAFLVAYMLVLMVRLPKTVLILFLNGVYVKIIQQNMYILQLSLRKYGFMFNNGLFNTASDQLFVATFKIHGIPWKHPPTHVI